MNTQSQMNVLTQRAMLTGSSLKRFNEIVDKESVEFNNPSTRKSFSRVPRKINGKWYIEQLIKQGNKFVTQMVRVSRIKDGSFVEATMFS